MQTIKKLYVIFKTHLDIGFTDFSENVYKKYMQSYIPAALKTAKELREEGGEARFVWTTGSWLIHQYVQTLNSEEYKAFAEQVRAGDIRWHGLPFTSHTELMDAELFKTGLGLSKELDERFGVKTIAAKMTDVPGHTRAIVPFMAKAGIEFMHIGVNPASAVPETPDIFCWKAPDGSAITVMYHKVYGTCSPLGNNGAAVYFAHAGDNLSPPSAKDIKELFAKLHTEYPDAEIIASDLNAVADELRSQTDSFPVITAEIGDSWIHGIGTDPGKVSRYRSLLRFAETIDDENLRKEFYRKLLPIPEHTWGLDEKTHLNDHNNFKSEEFAAVRNTTPYQKMEQSWREQRAYLDGALAVLPKEYYAKAIKESEGCKRNSIYADIENYKEADLNTVFCINGIKFSFNEEGAISYLEKDGKIFADSSHNLAKWSYTQLGPEDYKRFFEQYIRCDEEWALEDYDKIGMEKAVDCRHDYTPKLQKLYTNGDIVTAVMTFSKEANELYGCPEWVETTAIPCENGIKLDVAWFRKPANRRAEMLNLGFDSFESDISVRKLGEWIKPEFIKNSNRNLHGTDFGVKYPSMQIESLDGALVSFGRPAILDFCNETFDTSTVWFNLYNNQWGTNFPMWYEENARFRYIVTLK